MKNLDAGAKDVAVVHCAVCEKAISGGTRSARSVITFGLSVFSFPSARKRRIAQASELLKRGLTVSAFKSWDLAS